MALDEFAVAIVSDLQMDPRKMEGYEMGREQWLKPKNTNGNVTVVSLGDLGESKSVRPNETNQLFAGTTECHEVLLSFL
jgi:hypothetical protein